MLVASSLQWRGGYEREAAGLAVEAANLNLFEQQ
jgi:hypothetical protein